MAALAQLIDAESREVILAKLHLATSFWQRLRGLQFRRKLAPDEGLLIVPCRSVHTHWMRFSIDIAVVNREGLVVKVLSGIEPWRVVWGGPEAYVVVEAAAGVFSNLVAGTRLEVIPGHPRRLRGKLFSPP